jgi:trigger factor
MLIGAKKDEEKSFSLPYPKDFHMKNLAGKMVDFKVKIKEVYDRKMPEMDDSFAVSFGVKELF